MRTVIITTDGNPFAINLWYENFKKWSAEIDVAYVSITSNLDPEMVKSIENIFCNDKKIIFLFEYQNSLGKHSQAISNAISNIKTGNVLLFEEDIFILKVGFIDNYFKKLELDDFDVIGGGKRIHATTDLYTVLKNIYNIEEGYFPSMLFFNINLFKKIKDIYNIFYDLNHNTIQSDGKEIAIFSANYEENTIFTFLNNYKLKNQYSDEITGIFAILLKLNSKKILDITWLEHRHQLDFHKNYENWIHIGSVGGICGLYGSLRKKNKMPIFETIHNYPPLEVMFADSFQEGVQPEWERRMSYFLATYESWNHLNLISLKEEYLFGIKNFSETFNLSWDNICKHKENILSII